MADRAVLVSGQRPESLPALEEEIMHLGTDEDRLAAQRILMRAQDAHRMHLPGAEHGFIWIACLPLAVRFLDEREIPVFKPSTLLPDEARTLFKCLDESVRDLSKSAYLTSAFRPGVPTWPGVIAHSAVRCDADTRAWIGFHCVANMSTEVLSDFTMEGCTYSNSLMVCAAIPDESMQIQALQDPSRSIAETAYAKDMQARLQAGIEKAMTVMPQLELAFVASWQRMSELVEIGDAEGAASAMLADIGRQMSLPFGQAIEKIKLQFPAGVEIALGSARTEEPRPGQAGLMAMYAADGGNMVRSSFAALLTGTPLSAVADALKLHLTELGLSASFVALEPRKPVQRLDPSSMMMPCADGKYRQANLAIFGKLAYGFKSFDWEGGWQFDGPAFQSDDAIRKLGQLPHPIAMQVAGVDTALAAHYEEPLLRELQAQMDAPGRSTSLAISRMLEQSEDLRALYEAQYNHDMKFDTEWYSPVDGVTPPYGVYCSAHWRRSSGVLMVARRSLLDRLEETSIENGFPLSSLKLTYPDIYFHFEKPLRHKHDDGQQFSITGFYASEQITDAETGERNISLTYTYLYDGEVLRIGGLDFDLNIKPDDTRDITDVVAERKSRLDSTQASLIPHEDRGDIRFSHDTLIVAAKVILYTTLKNARMSEVKDRTKLIEQMRNVKGNQRDKLKGRIANAFDYIAIGPEDALGTEGDNELRVAHALEARGITPHWRRGFYRKQHHGVGRTLSYQVWIPPVLVNGHLVDGAPPQRKDYILD